MRCVEADGTAVLVARRGGELYALSDHCSHRGGPLHEGELEGDTRQLPAARQRVRAARRLADHGPAAYPQPALGRARARRARSKSAPRVGSLRALVRAPRPAAPAAAPRTADRRRRGAAHARARARGAAARRQALAGVHLLMLARRGGRDLALGLQAPTRTAAARVPVGAAGHRAAAALPGAAAPRRRARRRASDDFPAGELTWTSLLYAGARSTRRSARNSAICLLIAAIARVRAADALGVDLRRHVHGPRAGCCAGARSPRARLRSRCARRRRASPS